MRVDCGRREAVWRLRGRCAFSIAEVPGFVDVAMAENAGVFAHTKEKKPPARENDRGFLEGA